MLIKASSIFNLTDARYFAAKNVQWLGFNLEPNTDGFIDPIFMKNIREWVEGPKIVGEFSQTDATEIYAAAEFFQLDTVELQLHQLMQQTPPLSLEIILHHEYNVVSSTKEWIDFFKKHQHMVHYFLLKFNDESQFFSLLQSSHDWMKICQQHPIIFQFDFSIQHLAHLMQNIHPTGIAVRGGNEEKVGVKTFDDLDEIFEAVESFYS